MSSDSEQRVLSDVRSRAGFSFLKLGAIDTAVASTADAVLPVLADWVSLTPEENIRAAICQCFSTKYANAYIGEMLRWARQEPYELGKDLLIQAVVKAALPKDGVRIWSELKKGTISGFDSMLLAKLTAFPSVATEVKDYVCSELASNRWTVGDLQYIAKVKDPRILAWFENQKESADQTIRLLARRATRKQRTIPPFSYATGGPNRRSELFSTEVDIGDAHEILAELTSKVDARLPSMLGSDSPIWDCAEIARWIRLDLDLGGRGPATLWLRLEDVDTVQIVLTPMDG